MSNSRNDIGREILKTCTLSELAADIPGLHAAPAVGGGAQHCCDNRQAYQEYSPWKPLLCSKGPFEEASIPLSKSWLAIGICFACKQSPAKQKRASGAFYLLAKHRHVRIGKPLVSNDSVVNLAHLDRTGDGLKRTAIRSLLDEYFQAAVILNQRIKIF